VPNVQIGPLAVTEYGMFDTSTAEVFGPQETRSKTMRSQAAGGKSNSLRETAINTPIKHWATDLDTLYATDWFADFDASAIKRLNIQLLRYVLMGVTPESMLRIAQKYV
jgi:hypothetical protein